MLTLFKITPKINHFIYAKTINIKNMISQQRERH